MKWKMKWKIDLSIKKMLQNLVWIGVAVIIILSVTSILSNNMLIKSQKKLTDIVVPLDHANQQVKSALMKFITRKYSIIEAESIEKLKEHEERIKLDNEFTNKIGELKKLSANAGNINTEVMIKEIETLYNDMLSKDTILLDSVKKRLNYHIRIQEKILLINESVANLNGYTEYISEKIENKFQDYMNKRNQDESLPKSVKDFFLGEYSRAQKASSELKVSISTMIDFGRQMLMAKQKDQIEILKTDKIAQAGQVALEELNSMKMDQMKDPDMSEIIKKMEKEFYKLNLLLVGNREERLDNGQSISELRSHWIDMQTSIMTKNQELNDIIKQLEDNLGKLQIQADQVRSRAELEASDVNQKSFVVIICVGLGAILVMGFFGKIITRRILNPITRTADFADTISRGDLTAEIEKEHDDEIGNLVYKLSDMAHNLNTLISQVQRSGIQVTSSATELSATSKQQEAVMKTQLESTNYVLKSVEEISSVSTELVQTMKQVAEMSEQTAEFATKGQADLMLMEEAMRHMENASKSISGKLDLINEKAANITSVVTTITKVADQTNLLSLNAAIEAEKAGEYGRGFTVVAREIRRLADQTAVATLDIDQMVREMQSAVSAGVMEMDAFITEVQRSAENVGKISVQLTRIIQQVQALSPSFEGVNESMQIQSENAQKINSSMAHLAEEMQQTLESLQESFMAIEQLNDAARGLQDEVSRFKLM